MAELHNPNKITYVDPDNQMTISIEIAGDAMENLSPEIKMAIEQMLGGIGFTISSVINDQDSLRQAGITIADALNLMTQTQMKTLMFLAKKADEGNAKSN